MRRTDDVRISAVIRVYIFEIARTRQELNKTIVITLIVPARKGFVYDLPRNEALKTDYKPAPLRSSLNGSHVRERATSDFEILWPGSDKALNKCDGYLTVVGEAF